MNKEPIRDLTELLLHRVRQRPAMYLGNEVNEGGIWTLQTYILGYEMCHQIEKTANVDQYLDRFTDRLYARKGAQQGPLRLGPIIDECNGDANKSFQRFFEYLELFDREVPFGAEDRVTD